MLASEISKGSKENRPQCMLVKFNFIHFCLQSQARLQVADGCSIHATECTGFFISKCVVNVADMLCKNQLNVNEK